MGNKLSFKERQESQTSVNAFRNKYGNDFEAMILRKLKNGNTSKIQNEEVFILKGQYDDANMPNVCINDECYDCAYVKIRNYDDFLTIYLDDMTIDILPKTE